MRIEIAQWLIEETERRGWSFRELGRRAGLSYTTISKVVTGARLPGWEFCCKIARAFQMPAEDVLRLAGLLPPKPEETARLQEMIHLFGQLSPEDQERFVAVVRAFIASSSGPPKGSFSSESACRQL